MNDRSTTALIAPEELWLSERHSLDVFNKISEELGSDYDPVHGGFGRAPKFPHAMALDLLLRIYLHRQKGELQGKPKRPELEIVENTLRKMAYGGIHDRLGGGFHRYSTDAEWLAPHFEKMLYDNALLSRVYLHTYLVTGELLYRKIAEGTLDYVRREMLSPEGGFYSTQDADSEGVEGKFFLWTPEEIQAILAPDHAKLFMEFYDVTSKGNFEGKSILRVVKDPELLARQHGMSVDDLQDILAQSRQKVFEVREQRVKPGRDEKILLAWNGMMLKSFAEAARHLQRADYLEIATRNAEFLLNTMVSNGRHLRTYKDGRAHLNGYLEDYACFADGLLALYEASLDLRWFVHARAIMNEVIELFSDDEHGGFFDTGKDHEQLVARPKEITDNATPSGNSVAVQVLLRLSSYTGDPTYRQKAEGYLESLGDLPQQQPNFFAEALSAYDYAISPVKEIAIVGDPKAPDTQTMLASINLRYLPNSVLACAAPDDASVSEVIPLLADRPMQQGKATVYVCQDFACQAPATQPQELESLL